MRSGGGGRGGGEGGGGGEPGSRRFLGFLYSLPTISSTCA